MTALLMAADAAPENPIDLIEQLVADHEWPFERCGDGVLVKAGGQRAEHQTAMDSRIGIDVLDGRQQLVLRNTGRKQHATRLDANLFAAFKGAALVG